MIKLYIINFLLNRLNDVDKHYVLTQAVRKLYNTIGVEDILKEKDKVFYLEGKAINDARKKQIISEAQIFLGSDLWKVLQADIKYQANKRMFLDSRTEQDLIAGKLWTYMLDVMGTRLKSMNNERGNFNIK